jgi:hypothetical protein
VQGELALTNLCNISAANFEEKKACQLREISPVQGELALALSQSRTGSCQNANVRVIQSWESAR